MASNTTRKSTKAGYWKREGPEVSLVVAQEGDVSVDGCV